MGTTLLVDKKIEDGRKLVEALDASKFNLVGALWFYSDSGEWRLLLASPIVDQLGPRRSYTMIQTVLQDLNLSFGLDTISVISPNDNLIRLLKLRIRVHDKATARVTRNTINGVFIEDALIYRLE